MIIWLASYPKSGNTLVRSMLSAYFFSQDGICNFDLIKHINIFPDSMYFERLGINIQDKEEVIKNYIKVQESFNKKNSVRFLKTHSYLFNIKNNPFTNLNCSLGAIYIVRDPRNVVSSFAKWTKKTHEKAADDMINNYMMGGNVLKANKIVNYVGPWDGNYNSWKSFKQPGRYLLIKYEELIENKETTFKKILNFIFGIQGLKTIIDNKKFKNVILSSDFNIMKDLEKKIGFTETALDINKKPMPFFDLGPHNNWKKILKKEVIKKIERAFEKEMIELDYL